MATPEVEQPVVAVDEPEEVKEEYVVEKVVEGILNQRRRFAHCKFPFVKFSVLFNCRFRNISHVHIALT